MSSMLRVRGIHLARQIYVSTYSEELLGRVLWWMMTLFFRNRMRCQKEGQDLI